MTLDLSTGTTNAIPASPNAPGTADPKWQIFSAPPTVGFTSLPASPYSIPPLTGNWANPTAPATWIEASPVPITSVVPTAGGPYSYEVDFNIPSPLSSYASISLTGQCRADDLATLWLNSNNSAAQIQNCGPFTGNGGGQQPLNFSFSSLNGPGFFLSGSNAFQVTLQNNPGTPSGLMVSATLTAVCKAPTLQGILKVCKVAGPGIAVGTSFGFKLNGGPNILLVPAGPGPGGTCVVGPSFPVGTPVNVAEIIPTNVAVSNITVAVAPPGNVVNTNITAGTADLTIGSDVTEVTYTDFNKPGYLEICKSGAAGGSFMVTPGNLGPFVVAAGACSPAIQVSAGTVTIKEASNSGIVMNSCTTIPSGRLISCPSGTQTATVTVVPGDVSSQTIVNINNTRIINPNPVQ